jgi:hypothetical protein
MSIYLKLDALMMYPYYYPLVRFLKMPGFQYSTQPTALTLKNTSSEVEQS